MTARVPEWVKESLIQIAEGRNASVSEVITEAVLTYLKTTPK